MILAVNNLPWFELSLFRIPILKHLSWAVLRRPQSQEQSNKTGNMNQWCCFHTGFTNNFMSSGSRVSAQPCSSIQCARYTCTYCHGRGLQSEKKKQTNKISSWSKDIHSWEQDGKGWESFLSDSGVCFGPRVTATQSPLVLYWVSCYHRQPGGQQAAGGPLLGRTDTHTHTCADGQQRSTQSS